MMTPRFDGSKVAEFCQRLGEARRRLLRSVAMTDQELQGLSAPELEPSEEAARRAVTQFLGGLEGRERRELEEIQAATARRAAGRFGRCETCGAAILRSRLRAVPWARHCLACQRKEERGGVAPERADEEDAMGIRKSYGKNKKDKRPQGAIAVKRDETLRRARRARPVSPHAQRA